MSEHVDFEALKQEAEEAVKRLGFGWKHGEGDRETDRMLFLLFMLLLDIDKKLEKSNRALTRIEALLKKLVTSVTVVTVETDQPSYEHTAPVTVSGTVMLDGKPLPNTVVNLKITDSTEVDFPLPDTTTDSDGKFTASWTIPPEVAPGACTVEAIANGMTVTNTFTFNQASKSE